jgi:hypothetical protein
LSKSIEDLGLKGIELKNKMDSISKFEESFKTKVATMIQEEISKNNVIDSFLSVKEDWNKKLQNIEKFNEDFNQKLGNLKEIFQDSLQSNSAQFLSKEELNLLRNEFKNQLNEVQNQMNLMKDTRSDGLNQEHLVF